MNLSTFSSKYFLIKVLIGFLIVIGGLEAALRLQGHQPKVWFGKNPEDYFSLVQDVRYHQGKGEKIIIFAGDSRIEWAVSPEVVQEELKDAYQVYNLAFPGAAVRTLLRSLLKAKVYPDILVVGYSHLSVYWSQASFYTIQPVSFEDFFNARIQSWLGEHIVSFSEKNWMDLKPNEVDWIDERSVSRRGQAHIRYRLSRPEALKEQKKWYEMMYAKNITTEEIQNITNELVDLIAEFKEHGTQVAMIRMPIGDWALQLEQKNDPMPFVDVVQKLKIPSIDLNLNPEKNNWNYYDDIHVAPPDDKVVSRVIGQFLQDHVMGTPIEPLETLKPHSRIRFLEGWRAPEKSRSWAQDMKASVEIYAEKDEKSVDMTLHSWFPRRIAIFQNGKWVRTLQMKYLDFQRLQIPVEVTAGEKLHFDFYSDTSALPPLNGDPSPLSFFVEFH